MNNISAANTVASHSVTSLPVDFKFNSEASQSISTQSLPLQGLFRTTDSAHENNVSYISLNLGVSSAPRTLSTVFSPNYGTRDGIPFSVISESRNIWGLRRNQRSGETRVQLSTSHSNREQSPLVSEENSSTNNSDTMNSKLFTKNLITGNAGKRVIFAEVWKSGSEAGHLTAGGVEGDILAIPSQIGEMLSSFARIFFARGILSYTQKTNREAQDYVDKAPSSSKKIAEEFKSVVSTTNKSHSEAASDGQVAAMWRIFSSALSISGETMKSVRCAFLGDMGLVLTGYLLAKFEWGEGSGVVADSKENELIKNKCQEAHKILSETQTPPAQILDNILQMIESRQNPRDTWFEGMILKVCALGTAAESFMSVLHGLGLFFAAEQQTSALTTLGGNINGTEAAINQSTTSSKSEDNEIYALCTYLTLAWSVLGFGTSLVHLGKNYISSRSSENKEKTLQNIILGNADGEQSSLMREYHQQAEKEIRKILKPYLKNNHRSEETDGEELSKTQQKALINHLFGPFFSTGEVNGPVMNFEQEDLLEVFNSEDFFKKATLPDRLTQHIPEWARLYTAFHAADELSKTDPEFSLGILVHILNQNFRENKPQAVELLKHFALSDDEIQKLSEGAATPLGRKLAAACLAYRLKITTVL